MIKTVTTGLFAIALTATATAQMGGATSGTSQERTRAGVTTTVVSSEYAPDTTVWELNAALSKTKDNAPKELLTVVSEQGLLVFDGLAYDSGGAYMSVLPRDGDGDSYARVTYTFDSAEGEKTIRVATQIRKDGQFAIRYIAKTPEQDEFSEIGRYVYKATGQFEGSEIAEDGTDHDRLESFAPN